MLRVKKQSIQNCEDVAFGALWDHFKVLREIRVKLTKEIQ